MMEDSKNLTYTQAINELEAIVKAMQSDQCNIDNLNQYTSRSLELLKICKDKLQTTDEELKKILKELE